MISEVSKRYAQALYEQSKNSGSSDAVFYGLRVVVEAISKDTEILEFFESPLSTNELKKQALKAAVDGKLPQDLINFLFLLCDKGRFDLFAEIVTAYEVINDAAHGVTRGTVRSASPLGPAERTKIEETVNNVINKKVILSFEEDSTLLGGTVAQVGGWTFNDSLDSHLTRLNDELNRRSK